MLFASTLLLHYQYNVFSVSTFQLYSQCQELWTPYFHLNLISSVSSFCVHQSILLIHGMFGSVMRLNRAALQFSYFHFLTSHLSLNQFQNTALLGSPCESPYPWDAFIVCWWYFWWSHWWRGTMLFFNHNLQYYLGLDLAIMAYK